MGDAHRTMAEIEARYPNEWVLLDRPKADGYNDVIGGSVVWHHSDRDEFDRGLAGHRLADSAILFAGVPLPQTEYAISLWTDDSISG